MAWVAPVVAIIGTAMSAYSMMQQGKQQEAAAKRQEEMTQEGRRISEMNAQREETETAERNRRFSETQKAEEAQSRAAAAASGFAIGDEESGDSIALSLASQQRENRRQLGYETAAGASRASILRSQGNYQAMASSAQAQGMRDASKASYWGAAGQAVKAGGMAYDWGSKL